jgi:hypothetical protein
MAPAITLPRLNLFNISPVSGLYWNAARRSFAGGNDLQLRIGSGG